MSSWVYFSIVGCMLCLVLLGKAECADTAELSNGFIKLHIKGTSIVGMQVDPIGKNTTSLNFIKDCKPEFWQETADTKIKVSGAKAVIGPLESWEYRPVSIEQGINIPQKLEHGHVLTQSFTVPKGARFGSLQVKLPTWNSEDSGATLSLLKDGKLIASRKLENVKDNSWPSLELEKEQGEGIYTVQLSDPVGTIGWWSSESDVSSEGEGTLDGESQTVDRALRVNVIESTGTGMLNLFLEGNRLLVTAEFQPGEGEKPKAIPWRWKTSWTKDGYDCTPKAGVVFNRFFTDNQRYMPVEQLKRRDHGGLSFNGCKWIEMDGTRDADLRLEGKNLHMHWEMTPDEMSLRFDTPLDQSGEVLKSEWMLTVKNRDDSIPSMFPRFACSDPKLEADLNRFWWERGFTYAAPPNRSIEFSEWMAIIRSWFKGPQHEGEIKHLVDYPITDEGYVHTYGNIVGWPLVPNRDTRHFDTNARFIMSCWHHYKWTGDIKFLQSQTERLRKAMNYQLEVLQGKDGLIITPAFKTGKHEDLSNNYWDILPFGHLDAYANATFYGSILAMAEIEEVLSKQLIRENPRESVVENSEINNPKSEISALSTQHPALLPDFYRALAAKSHSRYDEVFWDEGKERYIGCVDSDGGKHDYGFTFINLEALYYGLGDKAKAKRIYKWMETEPTSAGKADTYSKWIFAPRANTIHNPMWRDNAPADELNNAASPWWTYWWGGTPYGDQCQDGGAILYTSYFDLMDRMRYLGMENAWKRFMEIIARYRMPDKLCGGSPLYRGETSQQESAGSVGVDYPFPESGLVPLFFLYGVIGVEPTPDGLKITPNLPESLSYAEVRYLNWQGADLRIRVERGCVEVEGLRRGKSTFKQKFNAKAGESVLFMCN